MRLIIIIKKVNKYTKNVNSAIHPMHIINIIKKFNKLIKKVNKLIKKVNSAIYPIYIINN